MQMMYHLCSTFYGTVRGDGKSHEPFVSLVLLLIIVSRDYQEVFTNYEKQSAVQKLIPKILIVKYRKI